MRNMVVRLERWLAKTRLGTILYTRPYRRVVEREISLANIRATDTVYHVGCGSVPFTALLIAEITRARVIAVDHDENAVKHARRVVEKHKLEHVIEVRHHDATELLDEPYTVAILALQTRPLDRVIEALDFRRARVVVREPSERYKSHYDVMPKTLQTKARVHHGMKAFASSALVIKRRL